MPQTRLRNWELEKRVVVNETEEEEDIPGFAESFVVLLFTFGENTVNLN